MSSAPPRARGCAVADARALMLEFADRTGLASERSAQRYLWTDAFAVCNFLALARATGEERHRELALRLVEQVHRVLGRHRADDARTGWISGLADAEGERHPTRGGLRIGKRLPERPPGAPFDPELEWDRDGQYFHYLTRWMHALDQVARETRQPLFNTWARELAETAHRAFTCGPSLRRRMVWKMSTDLSRPQVAAMGQHDPLDGLITCLQLRATAASLRDAPRQPTLEAAVSEFEALVRDGELATADPLGLGGLLIDACRSVQISRSGEPRARVLIAPLLAAARAGLVRYAGSDELRRPATQRLAFRELGLAIGLSALARIEAGARELEAAVRADVVAETQALARHASLGAAIGSFWSDPGPRSASTWLEHRDINDVMLASCLLPEGVLELRATA